MSTTTHRKVQWMIEAGAALVIIGIGLNVLVTQTLGTFEAASVLLTLYLALWAYVLGSIILVVLSIWLFLTRNSLSTEPMDVRPESEARELVARDAVSPGKIRLSPYRAAYRTH
jgi:hypothetical protein